MKERQIIFTNEHVEAILDGRKTQTRRVVKANDGLFSAKGLSFYLPTLLGCEAMHRNHKAIKAFMDLCPYGKPGDKLWAGRLASLILVPGTGLKDLCFYCVFLLSVKKM